MTDSNVFRRKPVNRLRAKGACTMPRSSYTRYTFVSIGILTYVIVLYIIMSYLHTYNNANSLSRYITICLSLFSGISAQI